MPTHDDNRRIGRARHSERAVVVNLDAWAGNSGGQRTARATCLADDP